MTNDELDQMERSANALGYMSLTDGRKLLAEARRYVALESERLVINVPPGVTVDPQDLIATAGTLIEIRPQPSTESSPEPEQAEPAAEQSSEPSA